MFMYNLWVKNGFCIFVEWREYFNIFFKYWIGQKFVFFGTILQKTQTKFLTNPGLFLDILPFYMICFLIVKLFCWTGKSYKVRLVLIEKASYLMQTINFWLGLWKLLNHTGKIELRNRDCYMSTCLCLAWDLSWQLISGDTHLSCMAEDGAFRV